MRSLRSVCFLLAVLSGTAAADELYFRAEADSYAAPVPIKAFITNWHAPLSDGSHAFLDARVESGVKVGDYRIAYVWGDDYLLHFTPETAAIYYAYKNNLPPPQGVNPLLIQAHHVETQGVHFARDFALAPDWQLSVGANLLAGLDLTQGELAGSADFTGPGFEAGDINSLNAGIGYHYSRPVLHEGALGWSPNRPHGRGASLDLGLQGDFTPRLHARVQLDNIAGFMLWDDAPATRYALACQCAQGQYDVTGQLQLDHRWRQVLPWTGRATLDYDLAQRPWFLATEAFANPWSTLLSAGAGYRFSAVTVKSALEPQTHSLLVDAAMAHGGLRWQSDTWNPAKAHRLGLSVYGVYGW